MRRLLLVLLTVIAMLSATFMIYVDLVTPSNELQVLEVLPSAKADGDFARLFISQKASKSAQKTTKEDVF